MRQCIGKNRLFYKAVWRLLQKLPNVVKRKRSGWKIWQFLADNNAESKLAIWPSSLVAKDHVSVLISLISPSAFKSRLAYSDSEVGGQSFSDSPRLILEKVRNCRFFLSVSKRLKNF